MRIYDLEQPRTREMPMHQTHKAVGYTYLLHRKHRDTSVGNGNIRTGASGALIMTEHTGTHLDALCHQAFNHRLNGGILITDKIESPYGFTVHGVESVEPLVARGILLDVAGHKGADCLPKRYEISLEDLKGCCGREGIDPQKGDVVLIRTGYGKFWDDPEAYNAAAGVSLDAAKWLTARGITATGADNMSWEVDDGRVGGRGTTLPCHVELLVDNGVYILENLNLEGLSLDKAFEFSFLCAPLKIVGATGSPVRPLAIKGRLPWTDSQADS